MNQNTLYRKSRCHKWVLIICCSIVSMYELSYDLYTLCIAYSTACTNVRYKMSKCCIYMCAPPHAIMVLSSRIATT